MNILSLLIVFFLIATVIKIATDNVADVIKPFWIVTKYKLLIALVLTTVGVFGLNMGVFEALNVPLEHSQSWFKYFDLIVTSLFLTGGAQAIHKLNDAWRAYNERTGEKNV